MKPTIDDEENEFTQTRETPAIGSLATLYNETVSDLSWYVDGCRDSYNWRRNRWPGKSSDLRKNAVDAFPFKGASDGEAHIIGQRIDTYIAMFMMALNRANIRAYPVEAGDMARARVVSNFLKWMVSSYIPQFKRQMELSANHLLERGIACTYVGWEREDRVFKQRLTLDELAQISPDLVRMVLEATNDEALIQLLRQQYDKLSEKAAKKVLRDLRKTGSAEFPISRRKIDRPCVDALSPDGDFYFPSFTTNPQDAPYCFWRIMMTAQQIRNKVSVDGWDKDWADAVLKSAPNNSGQTNVESIENQDATSTNDTRFEVVYCFQRLTDMDLMAEGIYCTVFAPSVQSIDGMEIYAKSELLNGYDDYPVVVTKLSEDDKRLYEVQTIPEKLRGCQWLVKSERDSRVDRNSFATLPAILYPAGRPPPDMGPGVKIPYVRQGEISFGPTPQYNPGSVEMEQTQILEADRIMGLDKEDPLSSSRQQFLVDKFLTHCSDVIKLAYKCYQRFGQDAIQFRVSGVADPQKFDKGNADEDFDVKIMFDVQMNDPENQEAKMQQFVSLLQIDKNGLIDGNKLVEVMAGAIDPSLADAVMQPAQEAQQQIVKQVTDDLSKLYAGVEVGARPNGAQIALQVIGEWAKQPDIMQRLQDDEAFKARVEKYYGQYTFQMQQAQNAQIGKLGTAPASVGQVNTQALPPQ